MLTFNSYFIDEIVVQDLPHRSLFGLIGNDLAQQIELSGFEVTTSGQIVVPLLSPQLAGRYAETNSQRQAE